MGKAIGILMIVLGVWIGMEIFTKGMDGAFGGLFTLGSDREPNTTAEPPVQRIRARVQRDITSGLARSGAGFEADESDDDE